MPFDTVDVNSDDLSAPYFQSGLDTPFLHWRRVADLRLHFRNTTLAIHFPVR